MGIVINRPLNLELDKVLAQMESISDRPVYHGWPVHTDRGFVTHRPACGWKFHHQDQCRRCGLLFIERFLSELDAKGGALRSGVVESF